MSDPSITVSRIGREGNPIVCIDNFSGRVDDLLLAGRAADFRSGGAGFPGMRAAMSPSYLEHNGDQLVRTIVSTFGFRQGIALKRATYSLVCTPERDLSYGQRLPHFDDASGRVVAIMHYLLGPESGGTAFFRHRRTGFESIDSSRVAAYDAALAKDEKEFGEPAAAYHRGNSERFECIAEIDARPDRLIMYRGTTLHSGSIPDPGKLSSDPGKGRLTINMFVKGT